MVYMSHFIYATPDRIMNEMFYFTEYDIFNVRKFIGV